MKEEGVSKRIVNSVTQKGYVKTTTKITANTETTVETVTRRKNARVNCKKWDLWNLKHAEQRERNSTKKRKEQRKEYKTKESYVGEQVTEYESKLEQIVNAVKEGFKSQNDALSSTLNGTNQEMHNAPANKIQQATMHQTQQTTIVQNTPIQQLTVHHAQQPHVMYEQNSPQIPQHMQPADAYQMN